MAFKLSNPICHTHYRLTTICRLQFTSGETYKSLGDRTIGAEQLGKVAKVAVVAMVVV